MAVHTTRCSDNNYYYSLLAPSILIDDTILRRDDTFALKPGSLKLVYFVFILLTEQTTIAS